jgi:ribosomal protein S18 acetylase RimI-like enzyme
MASSLQDPRICSLVCRPAEKAGDDFLARLYAATHGQALRLLPDVQRMALVKMQFEAQRQSYAKQYPGSERLVIWQAGTPIGQCWLFAASEELRILDLALLPERQGCGIGTAILRGLIDRTRHGGTPLRLSVQRGNLGALRLYRKLGFEQISESSVSIEMEHSTSENPLEP